MFTRLVTLQNGHEIVSSLAAGIQVGRQRVVQLSLLVNLTSKS